MEILSIIIGILLTVSFCVVCISGYFLIRNQSVYHFSLKIIDLKFKTDYRRFGKTPDYDKMLYSIKPLRVEYWLTEEQLKMVSEILN
jgi:hypothetical protein